MSINLLGAILAAAATGKALVDGWYTYAIICAVVSLANFLLWERFR